MYGTCVWHLITAESVVTANIVRSHSPTPTTTSLPQNQDSLDTAKRLTVPGSVSLDKLPSKAVSKSSTSVNTDAEVVVPKPTNTFLAMPQPHSFQPAMSFARLSLS